MDTDIYPPSIFVYDQDVNLVSKLEISNFELFEENSDLCEIGNYLSVLGNNQFYLYNNGVSQYKIENGDIILENHYDFNKANNSYIQLIYDDIVITSNTQIGFQSVNQNEYNYAISFMDGSEAQNYQILIDETLNGIFDDEYKIINIGNVAKHSSIVFNIAIKINDLQKSVLYKYDFSNSKSSYWITDIVSYQIVLTENANEAILANILDDKNYLNFFNFELNTNRSLIVDIDRYLDLSISSTKNNELFMIDYHETEDYTKALFKIDLTSGEYTQINSILKVENRLFLLDDYILTLDFADGSGSGFVNFPIISITGLVFAIIIKRKSH
jgi:hypothetical protein